MGDRRSEDDESSLEPLAVTVRQAAATLSVSDRTIRRMLDSGELVGVRIRGACRVQYASLKRLCRVEEPTMPELNQAAPSAARDFERRLKQRLKQRR